MDSVTLVRIAAIVIPIVAVGIYMLFSSDEPDHRAHPHRANNSSRRTLESHANGRNARKKELLARLRRKQPFTCPICLCSVDRDRVWYCTGCCKVYDFRCINFAFDQNNLCPTCRRTIIRPKPTTLNFCSRVGARPDSYENFLSSD